MICKGKEKYLFAMSPPPPPSSVTRSQWGGGWRAGSCLGILSGERGFSGKSIPRVAMAPISGE
jgi:hypothetical protein